MAAEAEASLGAVPLSCVTLEQYHDQHGGGQQKKLRVLQLVAMLCESVSDTVFTGIAQVGQGRAGGCGTGNCTAHGACHRNSTGGSQNDPQRGLVEPVLQSVT